MIGTPVTIASVKLPTPQCVYLCQLTPVIEADRLARNIPTASCRRTRTCGAQSTTRPFPLSWIRFFSPGSIFSSTIAVAKTNGRGGSASSSDSTITPISSGRKVGQKSVPKLQDNALR